MNFSQFIRRLVMFFTIAALAACGGGGPSSGNQNSQGGSGQINEGPEISSNSPPDIQQVQDFSIEAGAALEIGLLLSDPDGDMLTYEADDLPSFISTRTSNETLFFELSPEASDEGVYSIRFSVSDGEDSTLGSLNFTVVLPNRAPFISTINGEVFSSDSVVIIQEGQRSEIEIVVEDADGDQILMSNSSISLDSFGEIEVLSTRPNSATIVLEPNFSSSGNYTISLNLNDGEAQETIAIPLTVEQAFSGEISAISNGDYHSCVIEVGEIICWGLDEAIAGYESISLDDPIHLVSGYYFSCAANHNDVVCWGNFNAGQNNIPDMQGSILKLVAGYEHICALTTESVYCWGDESPFILTNHHGQADVPPDLENVIDISAGHFHTCALSENGSIQCWGANSQGESNPPEMSFVPTRIDLGRNRSCAADSLQIICWGNQSWYNDIPPPISFSSLQFLDIGNEGVSCAIDEGQLECWGDGGEDIVDYYHFGRMNLPIEINDISKMTVGNSHVCAVSDNGIDCWGAGEEGTTGSHNYGQSIVPSFLTRF